MISYRDRTYCPFSCDCKKGDECSRALTEEVFKGAAKVGLPICQFVGLPECYESKHCDTAGAEK